MGCVLLIGGLMGSALGVGLFNVLRAQGQVDLLVKLSYVVFLGTIGGLMMAESLRALLRARRSCPSRSRSSGWPRSAEKCCPAVGLDKRVEKCSGTAVLTRVAAQASLLATVVRSLPEAAAALGSPLPQ